MRNGAWIVNGNCWLSERRNDKLQWIENDADDNVVEKWNECTDFLTVIINT